DGIRDFHVTGVQTCALPIYIQSPYESGFWIKPKTFIRFRAPSRLLEENLKLYTVISYSWEFDKGMLRRGEPRHRIYVYYFELPEIGRASCRERVARQVIES